jgi:hypothetical protein
MLKGEILTYIDVDDENNTIMLTTASGRKIKIYHDQECCEYVRIESLEGDFRDLIGKVIIEFEHLEEYEDSNDYGDHQTKTSLVFKVDGATVISKWVGDSNGYYSESVDLRDI